MVVELARVVLLASGAAMLLLATLVLTVGIGRTLHRAFAALLAVRGLATLLPQLSTDPQWTWTAINLQPYFALAVAPLALYVLLTLGDAAPRRRGLGWIALGGLALLDLAYWADHGLFHTLAAGDAAIGALRAAPGIQYLDFGPLAVVAVAGPFLLAVLGLRLAMQYRSRPDDPESLTLLLVSAGLLVGALFDAANRLAAIANLLDGVQGFPWWPWGGAVLALPILVIVPAGLGVAVLASGRVLDPRPRHRLEGMLLVFATLAFFSGFVRLLGSPDSDVGGNPVVLVLLGTWRLAMPVLVAYALLRRDQGTAEDAPSPVPAPGVKG